MAPLNVSALRLTLNILPGLENRVLVETEGLLGRLYSWAESPEEEEPLRSYATGVLGAAMEMSEAVTDPENRERNNRLVPNLLARLRKCQAEGQEEQEKSRTAFKRPFSVFAAPSSASASASVSSSNSASTSAQPPSAKIPRRLSREIVENEAEKRMKSPHYGTKVFEDLIILFFKPSRCKIFQFLFSHRPSCSWLRHRFRRQRAQLQLLLGRDGAADNRALPHPPAFKKGQDDIHAQDADPAGGVPRGTFNSLSLFYFFPHDQFFAYFQFVGFVFNEDVAGLLRPLISVRETKDARLAFESLRFLMALFCHKKFVLEWVARGGVELLLEVPRPSVASTAVSQCLYFIICDDDVMEKVCLMPRETIHELVK